MKLTKLTAISPIDGRYRDQVKMLSAFFSEFGLIKYRLFVEVEYFIALCELPLPQLKNIDPSLYKVLRNMAVAFSEEEANHIKNLEKITNHDIKAIEYFLKEKFDELDLSDYREFVHFGLTSQDINNTAIPYSLKAALEDEYIRLLYEVIDLFERFGKLWADVPMLGKTHGQPASPTYVGKEIMVFCQRLKKQLELLKTIPHCAKFGGSTGNFNAHHVAYPNIDWHEFGNEFVNKKLGLKRSHPTTQIEHYDNLAALFDNLSRINTILIDFCRDIWMYISMGYFKQKIKEGEIGSSAMPHKVNPIDFENAEGNLGLANAFLRHMADKLPISRLQRDLTDSTVLRNIGVPICHGCIAFNSIIKGFNKLNINLEAINKDLEDNWAVVAEAIQTILRREGYPHPYETMLTLTRGNQHIDQFAIHDFIDRLEVIPKVKAELKRIKPNNYTGMK